jgi:hypothetical protein
MPEGIVHHQVIARPMKDPVFRQPLLGNPREVLAQEFQVRLPAREQRRTA